MFHAITETTAEQGGDTGFSDLHPDIVQSHILTRLDGPSLDCTASSSAGLRHLSSHEKLWSNICHSTWPSTTSPHLDHLISTFPNDGHHAFFSQAFPIIGTNVCHPSSSPPSELISAVDIHYKDRLILTKTHETETLTDWFQCSPFRIDLLEPKDAVPTPLKHPEKDEACEDISREMSLSWIIIDPTGRRAVNLSSHKPVAVQRHWLTGEVHVKYATIMSVDHGHVQCGTVVTCGGNENGEMQVKEVSLEMEDMDGVHLNGRDSLVILYGAMGGKRGSGRFRVEEGQRRYKEYVEMKRQRRERKLRAEGALDIFCVTFGVSILVAFCSFLFWR